jgi:hypothetical protein
MNAKQLMIGLGFSMLAAANAPALAVDAKTLPGAACQPNSSNPTAFYVASNGMLVNNSDAVLNVICPIVRDVMAINGSDGIGNAQVHVVDNNNAPGDPRVTCVLESRTTPNAGPVEALTDNSVAGASPNAQVLDYTDLSSSLDGYYFFRCTIPANQTVGGQINRSGIVAYRWSETD